VSTQGASLGILLSCLLLLSLLLLPLVPPLWPTLFLRKRRLLLGRAGWPAVSCCSCFSRGCR
jgi:hypothetical protein